MAWIKKAQEATTRYVGYFPTPQFWTIIGLWNEEDVKKQINILSLKCLRGKMHSKNVLTPLPYIEVTELEVKTVVIDYNYIKHGKLNIEQLCKTVPEQGAKELVVEELCTHIPKDLLDSELKEEAEIDGWDTGNFVAAIFHRTHVKADGKFREEIKKHTKEWTEIGGKISSLDLVGLREAKYWHRKGKYGTYDVNFNIRTLRLVMKALDPYGTLGRWREYKKEQGAVWALVNDKSIKEEK